MIYHAAKAVSESWTWCLMYFVEDHDRHCVRLIIAC